MAASLPAESPARRRFSWRTLGAVALIVLATILTPPAILAAWAKGVIVDEDTFVATLGPLAQDPAIQDEITEQVSAIIVEQLDVDSLVGDTFDGLASLDLPGDAKAALILLRDPAAQGAKTLIRGSVSALVETETFNGVWRSVLITSHRAFVTVAGGSVGGGTITLDDQGYVALHLGPVIDEAKAAMIADGFALAERIPNVDTTIILARSEALGYVGTVYHLARAVGWLFPLGVMALFIGGIALSRNRRKGVIGSGVGLAIGAGVTLAALQTTQLVVAVQAGNIGVTPAALSAFFAYLVSGLREISSVLVVIGLVLIATGWLTGRSSTALAVQAVVDGSTTSAAVSLATHGDRGRKLGAWLWRNRVFVRAGLALLALVLLLVFKSSLATLWWIALGVLFLWWVTVVLEKTATVEVVEGEGEAVGVGAGEVEVREVVAVEDAGVVEDALVSEAADSL